MVASVLRRCAGLCVLFLAVIVADDAEEGSPPALQNATEVELDYRLSIPKTLSECIKRMESGKLHLTVEMANAYAVHGYGYFEAANDGMTKQGQCLFAKVTQSLSSVITTFIPPQLPHVKLDLNSHSKPCLLLHLSADA